MSGIFKFKQFEVNQSGCAMKINTDGVLLGASAGYDNPKVVLDIGTGTGVIALMLAQRFADAYVDAVEIDEAAATTAKDNFKNSAFAKRLTLYYADMAAFFKRSISTYDLIVSNPPFYINSLESPGEKKSLAKHSDKAFFEELIANVAKRLNPAGACWLVLPPATAQLVRDIALGHQLHQQQTIYIKSYPDSLPHREIMVLNRDGAKQADVDFVIYAEPKIYSAEYQRLLEPFFTIF